MSLRNRHFNLRDKVFMCKITRIKSGGMIMGGGTIVVSYKILRACK